MTVLGFQKQSHPKLKALVEQAMSGWLWMVEQAMFW